MMPGASRIMSTKFWKPIGFAGVAAPSMPVMRTVGVIGFTSGPGAGARTATGHIMGTCRMGSDPRSSVLDRWCRSHEVPNLWVVDGSFFPTSGGYNPTLTIFANAYRVAAHFIAEARRLNLG